MFVDGLTRSSSFRTAIPILAVLTLPWAARAGAPEGPAAHGHGEPAAHAHESHGKTAFAIPESMQVEHEAIHSELVAATKAKGRVGEAARALAKVLHPHFVREEEIALPPIGLLKPLSRGETVPGMEKVLELTEALRAELPRMLEEHVAIAAAARRLETVAREERHAQGEHVAVALALHAKTEEEVFYPATLLVGDLVKARHHAQH